MDSILPREQQLQDKRGDRNNPSADEFQMYTNERHIKKDSAKKKIRYRRGITAEDDQFQANATFQIPEKDKNRHFKFQDDSFGKTSKYSDKHYINPEQLRESSGTKTNNPSLHYDQDVNYVPTAPFDPSLRNYRFDDQKNNNFATQNNGKEPTTNQVTYNSPIIYSTSQEMNKRIVPELPNSDVNKNPSLICRALNNDGKPVTVNNQVIKDKLILSCRPRTYYGPGGYLNRAVEVDKGRIPNYVYPPPQVSFIDSINMNQTTDININQYQQKRAEELEYLNTTRKSVIRSNAYDMGSLGLGDQGLQKEKQSEKYEEQYRVAQCKRYLRTFKTFLWGLFIINLLLLLTGIALLLITLVHILFKPYVNTVIGNKGFATWIWITFALSLLIILVALYGIATSLTRARKMLYVYCILALILVIIILIFLLIFWLVQSNLKSIEKTSMSKTFHVYRCHRWVRVAWDSLHEKFECCGVQDRGDWKYIPPSCCQAENKYQKLRCINHFLQEDQAFKSGCRKKLEDYFVTTFLLITCLLVLAIILLVKQLIAWWKTFPSLYYYQQPHKTGHAHTLSAVHEMVPET